MILRKISAFLFFNLVFIAAGYAQIDIKADPFIPDINGTTVPRCAIALPVSIAVSDSTICKGSTAVLSAVDITGANSLFWTQGNSALATGAAVTVSPQVTTDYRLDVYYGAPLNCRVSIYARIHVNDPPTAYAGEDVTICPGDTAILDASGGGTYTWTNGSTVVGTTQTIRVTPSATTTYTVTVKDYNGCTDSDDVVVNVNTDPASGCVEVQNVYVPLKKKLDGGYYITKAGILYFKYYEEYKTDAGARLIYNIYDASRAVKAGVNGQGNAVVSGSPLLNVIPGDNRYQANLGSLLVDGNYYVLEVITRKQERSYIRFKFKS